MHYSASIELNDNVLKFINYEKTHNENFLEIRNLFFTKEKKNKHYSIIEIFNLIVAYREVKNSAINKLLNNRPLTFLEGFLIDRLLMQYNNEYIPIEIHLEKILKDLNFNDN